MFRLFSLSVMALGWVAIGTAQAQSPSTSSSRPLGTADWSGFYIGAGAGAVLGQSNTSATTEETGTSYFTDTDFAQLGTAGHGSMRRGKPTGGLEVGYVRQFGQFFVGLEASANTLFLDQSRTGGDNYLTQPAEAFTLRQRVKADWQATLRPRVGWAQDNWLAYVTAGVAVSEVTLDVDFSDTFNAGARGNSSNTEIVPGFTAGFGGEYALNENWSLRASYLYVDFGKVETSTRVTNASFPALSDSIESSADLRTHTFLIGVTYRFGDFW
ncbi:MAG: outer membrane beta-barrel protein [Kiloniellaceae bacterium]